MADGKIRREDLFDESALQAINEVAEGMKKLADSFRVALLDAQKLNKEISKSQSMKELNKQTVEAQKLQNKLTLENKKFETQMRNAEVQTKRVALAEERATKAKEKFDTAQVRATKNTNTWGKALGSFAAKFNTIGNVVGGALLKIGSNILRTTKEFISFDKIINSVQSSGDAFAVAIAGLKGGFEALNRAVATGNWSTFFQDFRKAAEAGREFARAIDEIGDRERAVQITNAKYRDSIEELRLKIRQESLYTLKERKQFAEEALELEKTILQNNLDISDEKYNALAKRSTAFNKMTLSEQEKFLTDYKIMGDKFGDLIKERAELEKDAADKVQQIWVQTDSFGGGKFVTDFKEGWKEAQDALSAFDMKASQMEGYREWMDLLKKSGDLNDKERIALTDALVERIEVTSNYSKGVRRLSNEYESLLRQEEKFKEAERPELIDIEKFEADIEGIDDILAEMNRDVEDFYSQINDITEESYEDQLKIRKKWYKVFRDLRKEEVDEEKRIKEQELRDAEELERMKEDIVRQGFDVLSHFTDNRLTKLHQAMEREIAMTDGSAEARTAIEQKYHRERIKLEQRQANINKLAASFNIIINTAVAISKALATPFLVPFIAALGAAQLAAVIAQPIPQYWKGTESSKEGPAWVGERGREMMIDQYGGMQLSPDRPTLTYLKRGTRVIPAHKTKEIIESVQVSRVPGSKVEQVHDNKDLIKAFREREQPIVNINSAGISVMTRSATTLTKRIDKYFR